MIALIDVCKAYSQVDVTNFILFNINLLLHEKDRIGILCDSNQGKSTFARVLCGAERIDSGLISLGGLKVSWPVGYSGFLHAELSGVENIRLIALQSSVDPDWLIAYCMCFSKLGDALSSPIRVYSTGMKAKLAFSISFALNFDFYLVDESFGSGDADFRLRCEAALKRKFSHSGLVFFSKNPNWNFDMCNRYAVLHAGVLREFESHSSAKDYFNQVATNDFSKDSIYE